jgi:hypothetical protein
MWFIFLSGLPPGSVLKNDSNGQTIVRPVSGLSIMRTSIPSEEICNMSDWVHDARPDSPTPSRAPLFTNHVGELTRGSTRVLITNKKMQPYSPFFTPDRLMQIRRSSYHVRRCETVFIVLFIFCFCHHETETRRFFLRYNTSVDRGE